MFKREKIQDNLQSQFNQVQIQAQSIYISFSL